MVKYPNVETLVHRIYRAGVSDALKQAFVNSSDVLEFHEGYGQEINRVFGLWNVNKHLGHQDVVVHKILEGLQNVFKSEAGANTQPFGESSPITEPSDGNEADIKP